jgi:hypothetical protein
MWLAWTGFALIALMTAVFIPASFGTYNTFDGRFGVYGVSLLLLPIVVGGGLRYLLARMRQVWLMQIPFFLGVLSAFFAGQFGLYMLPAFLLLFQILSAILFLLYLPLFVKFPPRSVVPPLPGA